jgi:hypothetical protein|tara:strand:- start:758 stop:1231 length:474 start_codon:yes stop_codon:yes gene_type:complete
MYSRKWDLESDYSVICQWCKEFNWDLPVPKDVLPPNGIVITDNDPICIAFLYKDQYSKFGFMYGIFSNPKISKIKLFRAMKLCVNEIKQLAKNNGIKIIYTVTGEKVLQRLYEKHLDIKYCESNIKSYIINLDKEKYNDLDWISENRADNLWTTEDK